MDLVDTNVLSELSRTQPDRTERLAGDESEAGGAA